MDKEKALATALVAALFAGVFLYLTMPIYSVDFWWHLASGRWMWQERSLMTEDPFGFVAHASDSALWRGFVLRQFWLSQLATYGVYLAGGFKALLVMRALTFTLMCAALYHLMRRAGTGRVMASMLMALALATIVEEYTYVELRPQMFSSLFFTLLLIGLERMREGRGWGHAAVPVLMLLWCNLHAGFVFGVIVIGIYVFVGLVTRKGDRWFHASLAMGVLVTGINPSGYTAFWITYNTIFEPELARYWGSIVETQSIFSHTTFVKALKGLPYTDTLLALVTVSIMLNIRRIRQVRLEYLLLFALTFVMGVKAIRYMVFFSQAAVLLSAANLVPVSMRVGGWFGPWPRLAVAMQLLVLIPALVFGYRGYGYTALGSEHPYNREYMGAVGFISTSGIEGRIFNDYSYGGYLIWWLWPRTQAFIDERGLSYEGFQEFVRLVREPYGEGPGGADPRPYYKRALEFWGIETVVLPGCDRVSGVTIPLSYALLNDPEWAVVYADPALIVFKKATASSYGFIREYGLPKSYGYRNVLALAMQAEQEGHGYAMANVLLSKAIGFMGIGERQEARRYIEQYLGIRPGDENALAVLEKIRRM